MANQFDYILFVCGFAFLLLTAVVWARLRPGEAHPPGKWPAFFAAYKAMLEASRAGRWLTSVIVVMLLCIGFLLTNWRGQVADGDQRAQLLQDASAIARQISVDSVKTLSFTNADQTSVNFQRLHRQMMDYARLVGLRSLYSMALRDERIVFGPGSLVVNNQKPLPPGTTYEKPPAGLGEVFHSRHGQVIGPYTDEFGCFLSAFVPVIDPQTGATVLVIGMDIEAQAWQAHIAQSRLNPILFTLMLLLMILAGSALLAWRSTLPGDRQKRLCFVEVWLTAVFGLAITVGAVFMVHDDEGRSQQMAFSQLAESQAWNVVNTMLNLRDFQLEGLGLSLSDDSEITRQEFRNYTSPLVMSGIAQAWEWIPAVPAADKWEVEQAARREGLADFTIYEKDQLGRSVPAVGRDVYYPVYYVEPLVGNERALGYDLGSESMRRVALEEATRTGKPTATDSVTLVQETGTQQGAIIYRPVYVGGDRTTPLRGFALAVLRYGAMLDHILPHYSPNSSTAMVDLFQVDTGKPPRLLASSYPDEITGTLSTANKFEFAAGADFAISAPLFAFGKTYAVLVRPGVAFLAAHRRMAGWAMGLAGLLVTMLLTLFVGLLASRRSFLEAQVHARTAELRQKTALLASLLDSIADIVFFKDRQGVYLGCNPEFARFVGRSREDIIGRTDYDLFPREVADFFRENDLAMMAGQASRHNEEWVDYPDGSRALVDTLKSPLRNAEGHVVGVLGVSRDITEREAAEAALKESEERYRVLFESSPDAVMIVDPESGSLLYGNAAAIALFGYDAEEIVQLTASSLHPEEAWEDQVQADFGSAVSGSQSRFVELLCERKDGSRFFADVTTAPLTIAARKAAVAIFRDVTALRRAAEELRLAKDGAEAANRMKSLFLANMSHEIRTPLNAILGFSQLLQLDPALMDEQKGYLDIINRSGEHLLTLINDILEMSKIEAGRTQLNLVDSDFYALLKDVEAMFRVRTEERGLLFGVNRFETVPRYLHADTGKIMQVLMNMLGNAVKFTEKGGITVRVMSERPPAAEGDAGTRGHGDREILIAIEVTDTGPGIAPEEIATVFEPFEQTRSGRYQGRGTGLGMAISRRFARMMGGDLSVTSEVGKGCTFCFSFLAEAFDTGSRQLMGAVPPGRVIGLKPDKPAPKVLVVDDNETNREVLRRLLETVGFQVREATGGREAVAVSEEWRPAMVLMDRRMPEMDGLEATRAIKAGPGGGDMRVVIVTAGVLEDDEQECLQAGADGFIPKPFMDREVMAVIGRLLDVDFVYEETGPVADSLAGTFPQAVARLPADLRAALIEATEAGDVFGLKELIEKRVAPREPGLALKLLQLVEFYDYSAILETLK